MSSLPILVILLVFMAYTFRQQKAQKAKVAAMNAAMVEGAEVVTTGGIYGFVSAIEGNVVWLEVSDGIEVRVAGGDAAGERQLDGALDCGLARLVRAAHDRQPGGKGQVQVRVPSNVPKLEPGDPHKVTSVPARSRRPP